MFNELEQKVSKLTKRNRAEVMKYPELIEFGSEAELKRQGKLYVQGKDYIVEEGDILNIRFNV